MVSRNIANIPKAVSFHCHLADRGYILTIFESFQQPHDKHLEAFVDDDLVIKKIKHPVSIEDRDIS